MCVGGKTETYANVKAVSLTKIYKGALCEFKSVYVYRVVFRDFQVT